MSTRHYPAVPGTLGFLSTVNAVNAVPKNPGTVPIWSTPPPAALDSRRWTVLTSVTVLTGLTAALMDIVT